MLTFAQPAFLFALAAVALPFVIHRISRARPLPWRFSSISRIQRSPLPRQGRRKISDWLLMAMRMALLALIILALAGPSWVRSEPVASAQQRETILVIDRSASHSGWNAAADLQHHLDDLEAQLSAGGQLSWIVFSNTVEAAYRAERQQSGAAQLAALRNWLVNNPQRMAASQPQTALQQAASWVETGREQRLILIADFQASAWGGDLPPLPKQMELHLWPTGQQHRANNMAILQARSLIGAEGRLRLLAEVMNFSDYTQSAEIRAVSGNQETRLAVELPPKVVTAVGMELPFREGGTQTLVELLAADDPYAADNRYHLWAATPPPLEIFAFQPADAALADAEEVFFLEQALAAASAHEWLRFGVVPAGVHTLQSAALARAGAVFVPASESAGQRVPWELLQAFVAEGGWLITTLGEEAVRGLQRMQSAGFSPGNYIGMAARGNDPRQRFHVGDLPRESPLAEIFTGTAARDLYLLTIRQFARIRKPDDAHAWLTAEDGSPLLYSVPHGRGFVVIAAFPWHTHASDLPLRPSFLPIMREIMGQLPAIGERILRLDTYTAFPSLARFSGPPPDMTMPQAFLHEGIPVEINIPRAESVLETVPVDRLRERLQEHKPPGRTPDSLPVESATAIPLASWLALAAVLFFLLEGLLSLMLIRNPQSTRS